VYLTILVQVIFVKDILDYRF